jgi:hypothetical protein
MRLWEARQAASTRAGPDRIKADLADLGHGAMEPLASVIRRTEDLERLEVN